MSKEVANRTLNTSSVGSLSRYDKILLSGAAAGKSPDELSRLVNNTLEPAQALAHVRALLASRNVWELPERKQLTLYKLQELADDIATQYQHSGSVQEATLLLKTLTQVATLLDKQSQITEEELRRVNEAQAREIVGFFTGVVEYVRDRIREEHPDIPAEIIQTYMYDGIAETRNNRYNTDGN